MKRTPGKIGIDVKAIGTKWNIGTLGSGREIALVLDVVGDDGKRSIRTANAQHIVKCWNGCEGIHPDAVPMLLAACIRAQASDDGSDPITTNVLNGAINRALGVTHE